MKHALLLLLALLLAGPGVALAVEDDDSSDPLSRLIWDMFQMRRGKTLCLADATPLPAVRANVANQLRRMGAGADPSRQAVAVALWTLYPCPFSPLRSELRPATETDIQGVWLFPEDSQRLRSWLRVARRPADGAPAARCDAVGYYPNGELRHAVVGNPAPCPFRKAADLEAAVQDPASSHWSLLRDGRIRITRGDPVDQVEEWDVYSVLAPFQVEDVQFKAGDLVAYARREAGNEVNAATQFHHLRRLQ